MLKIDFSKEEYENFKNKIFLTDMQERILEYRIKEYSITKMSTLENCSESTISREIKKIKNKLDYISSFSISISTLGVSLSYNALVPSKLDTIE